MIARAQDALSLAARLLLASALLPTGIGRALNVSGFAVTLAGSGVPAPNAMATAMVVVQVFGPLAVILGVMPRLTGLALAGFAACMALVLHPFWHFVGPAAITERTFLLADLGLAGGFLIYALAGPGAWSWQGWRAGAAARPANRPAAKGEGRGTGKGTGRKPANANGKRAGRPAREAA